ncbi:MULTISPECIES: low specificity L-threonine aldolase [Terrabacteria group]|uniref:threonine aldolase family protein n=1 Tax=Bacillati TaxID=1783272 RepID=UPI001C6E06CA|nr:MULTISPECIES: beta-eliminating lyase-related protein [Terrabacteria group]MBW9212935.1 low specificity L-threonine aldolase [Trueperella sp. zg.1013]
MILFENDYSKGCIPEILEKLNTSNFEQNISYGLDRYCEEAKKLIQEKLECDSEIHFLVGGTQTNVTVLSHILRPYQSVLTADSGHINTHETGAIEALGHKCSLLPSQQGKLSARQVQEALEIYEKEPSPEHCVQPAALYISFPTETGLLYSKKELIDLHSICQKYKIPFFIDGARLGYGLCAKENDVQFKDLAHLCDIFYIGGTKIGALFGEAVIFNQKEYAKGFRLSTKQKGGLLAKGFLLGIQFQTLFEKNRYFQISKQAIEHAERLKNGLQEKVYSFFYPCQSNQLFPILPKKVTNELRRDFGLMTWQDLGEEEVIRMVTDWATKKEDVEAFLKQLPRKN